MRFDLHPDSSGTGVKPGPPGTDQSGMESVRPASDTGGIVLGWLLKMFIVFGLVGIVLYDAIAISYGRVAAADDARTVARAASDAMVVRNADAKEAAKLALSRADSRGITMGPDAVTVAKDGSVTVVVDRDITTLVTYRIGPIAHLSHVTETYTTPALK